MARNKYPEQTVEKILEVSARLFLEKGYDNTSLQDILNELGGLTKGAIYHHFKSKEDIFDAIAKGMGEANIYLYNQVKSDNSLTGAEKLKHFTKLNIFSIETKDIINLAPNLLDNPKFLAIQMKQIRDVVAPKYISPLIEEGILDGSIKTDNAYVLAEAISLLINVWLNPLILGGDTAQISAKCRFINEFLAPYNLVLFDEEMIDKLTNF